MVRPILGMDCDGVLANFDAYCRGEINRRLGTDYAAEDVTTWDYGECLGPEAARVCREVMATGDCYRYADPFDGALGCVEALAEQYEIWLVTSIPPTREAYTGRAIWLEAHGFLPYLAGVVPAHGSYKPTVARGFRMAAFVEDHPGTATAVADAGIPSYLVERPCNRATPLAPLMLRGSLEAITDRLLAVAARVAA